MKVSIIIRTRNEEQWIGDCLKGVFDQRFQDFEVILVDNESSDQTLARARKFPVQKFVAVREYLPGKALNLGIREAEGELVVCLSGHCIPASPFWLENLVKCMDDPRIAGAYGRQEPLSFTPDADKRDLMIIFGPERRIQQKDSFFHNANSIIRRAIWERIPFDEQITNIEDRIWAKAVLKAGYLIAYEPEASVYHYHGIHQNGDEARCRNVVRILEDLSEHSYEKRQVQKLQELCVAALIPIRSAPTFGGKERLIAATLESARASRYIGRTVVSTDDQGIAETALGLGADQAFLRDPSLSHDYIGLEKVYQDALQRLEATEVFPDLVVLLEIIHPFREGDLIDRMIDTLYRDGLDTILPARHENNAIWSETGRGIERMDEGFLPRKYKKAIYLSYKGLCCVTRPHFIRSEQIIGDKVGIYRIDNLLSCLAIREEKDFRLAEILVDQWLAAAGRQPARTALAN